MRTRSITVPLLLAAVGVAGGAVAASASNAAAGHSYTVKLSGAVEVPKGEKNGGGTATITVKATQLCWNFKLKGVAKPLVAHLHAGAAGVAGPVVLPLGGAYKASGCATPSKAKLLTQIVAKPKGFYVNIHNKEYPAGAVRAQL